MNDATLAKYTADATTAPARRAGWGGDATDDGGVHASRGSGLFDRHAWTGAWRHRICRRAGLYGLASMDYGFSRLLTDLPGPQGAKEG